MSHLKFEFIKTNNFIRHRSTIFHLALIPETYSQKFICIVYTPQFFSVNKQAGYFPISDYLLKNKFPGTQSIFLKIAN